MLYLIVFKAFLKLFGRAGHVSVSALQKECKMSRSTANRYMSAMVDSGLVCRVSRGKYVLKDTVDNQNGYCRAILPLDYYCYLQHGSVNEYDRIPF